MPHRFILYDALHSLNKGHTLYAFGETSFLQHLEGCPEVHVVIEKMVSNGWIKPSNKEENQFIITDRGREVYEEGHKQYQQFSLLKRLLARPLLLRW